MVTFFLGCTAVEYGLEKIEGMDYLKLIHHSTHLLD